MMDQGLMNLMHQYHEAMSSSEIQLSKIHRAIQTPKFSELKLNVSLICLYLVSYFSLEPIPSTSLIHVVNG